MSPHNPSVSPPERGERIDPWSKDSTASQRALVNARDAERAALNLLVDVRAGAFAGADAMDPIARAIESLAEAYRISQERWTQHLDSFHQEKAA